MDAPLLFGAPVRRSLLLGHVPKVLWLLASAGVISLTVTGCEEGDDASSAGSSWWQHLKHEAERAANSSEAHHLEEKANETWQRAKKGVEKAANSSEAHDLEGQANHTLQRLRGKAAVVANSTDVREAETWMRQSWTKAANSKEATEAAEAAQRGLSSLSTRPDVVDVRAALGNYTQRVKDALPQPPHTFVIPPRCLTAMAVGAAVPAAASLPLDAFGFGAEGVEAKSMAAMWQSYLGTVRAASLFSKLQSLGAKDFAKTSLRAAGPLAAASFYFCESVDILCHGCISAPVKKPTV